LGQYGKIVKIIINKAKPFNAKKSGCYTYSAYVTYSNDIEASLAVLVPLSLIHRPSKMSISSVAEYKHPMAPRSRMGLCRYCYFYLRKKSCQNKGCLYLHSEASKHDILSFVLVCNAAEHE